MTDPHAEIRTPRDIGEPSDTAVDAAAEAMWRAEVAAVRAASYARSSEKWEEQADDVRVKWTDLARAALSVTRTPTGDPPNYNDATEAALLVELGDDAGKWAAAFCQAATKHGLALDEGWMATWFANAIENSHALRIERSWATPDPSGAEEMREALQEIARFDNIDIKGPGRVQADAMVQIAKDALAALPIPRPSTGGTDGKSARTIAEDIVSQVAVNEYQAHRLADLIAAAIREDRASRTTTEARVGEGRDV